MDSFGRRYFDDPGDRRPRIVLTGGPASGKSSTLDRLKEELGGNVVVVPELISHLDDWGMAMPADARLGELFDANLAEMQKTYEINAEIQARAIGAKLVVLDRGVLDKAAYMPGGVTTLELHLRTMRSRELARYELVLCFEIPPKEIYERVFAEMQARTGKYRRETAYEVALDVHRRTVEVWQGHKNFQLIGNHDGAEGKYLQARRHIEQLLATA